MLEAMLIVHVLTEIVDVLYVSALYDQPLVGVGLYLNFTFFYAFWAGSVIGTPGHSILNCDS